MTSNRETSQRICGDPELYERIVQFVARERGEHRYRLNPDTSLYNDLG
jgi:hypothetical protein